VSVPRCLCNGCGYLPLVVFRFFFFFTSGGGGVEDARSGGDVNDSRMGSLGNSSAGLRFILAIIEHFGLI
jgi:hypothetical protein